MGAEQLDTQTAEPDVTPGQETPPENAPEDAEDFPADTPTSEMSDAEKAAFYKAAARKWERRAKAEDTVSRSDYNAVKTQLDELQRAGESDNEKALREAREAGAAETREAVFSETASALLRMSLRASGVTDDDDLSEIVSFANLSAFKAEDGSINEQKMDSFVKRHAPKAPRTWPDMGQNKSSQRKSERGIAAGAALYEATHKSTES